MDPGRYIPFLFLLYSWGSLSGVPSKGPLGLIHERSVALVGPFLPPMSVVGGACIFEKSRCLGQPLLQVHMQCSQERNLENNHHVSNQAFLSICSLGKHLESQTRSPKPQRLNPKPRF